MSTIRSFSKGALAAACLLLLAPAAAQADQKAALDVGINFYGSDVGKSLTGETGYFMHFMVKSGAGWLHPTFGASLEYMSGAASIGATSPDASMIAGNIEGGLEVMPPQTGSISPFIGGQAVVGWASLSLTEAETRTLAITYGFILSGGAEVKLSSKEDGRSLRIRTGYRFLTGRLGGLSSFQLNALQVSIGLVF